MTSKRLRRFCLVSLMLILPLSAQMEELRGVWIAWAGSNIPSKSQIATMMDNLAAANVNTVYVDVWRYGYTYFPSEVFFEATGVYNDPALPEGRDLLMEFVAEAHRVGLHVEAWFENGFVAGQGNSDILYQAKPHWFAQRRDGTVLFNGNDRKKWLAHANEEVRQFLIDMVQEAIVKYDIDGVELDRIRYPELDCGYDSATVALYIRDTGMPPPNNVFDPSWTRWRADNLSEFIAASYDSFKAVNPDIIVSNAPIVYPYGYQNFAQDWRPWINDRGLDVVSVQVYRPTLSTYVNELNLQRSHVTSLEGFFPGIAAETNGTEVPALDLIAMIDTTRALGMNGHVVWFYDAMDDDLGLLGSTVYSQPATVPGRPADWRRPALIRDEDDPAVARSGNWQVYTTSAGYQNDGLFADDSGPATLEYRFDVPEEGWYEAYAFQIILPLTAALAAPYAVTDVQGTRTVTVNQTKEGLARWVKLDDVYLEAGTDQTVVRLSNDGVSGRLVLGDAVMLVNSNRLSGNPTAIGDGERPRLPEELILRPNYPNPFNPSTRIEFALVTAGWVDLTIYDVTGREVAELVAGRRTAGSHSVTWDGRSGRGDAAPTGVYFATLRANGATRTIKMLLVR